MKHTVLVLSLALMAPLLGMSSAQAKAASTVITNAQMTATQQETPMYEFNDAEELKRWLIVNDGVMGGLSKSQVTLSDNNTAVFKGAVSLENNGGFASIRTVPRSYGLDAYTGVKMRVKGDGKTYQFRARTDERFDGVSYRYAFKTEADKWMTIEIPFAQCEPVFRGRVLTGEKPLASEDIKQLGLLIATKAAGEFELEIDWIRAYKNNES